MAIVHFFVDSVGRQKQALWNIRLQSYSSWLPERRSSIPDKDIIILDYPTSKLTQREMVDLADKIVNSDKTFLIQSNDEVLFTALRVAVRNSDLKREHLHVWYKNKKVELDWKGRVESWPDGFFDTMDELLEELM